MKKIYHIAAELPTDRFYISDDAAYDYIRKRLLHNMKPKFVNPFKQRLFESLYEEVTQMMEMEKYQKMGWRNTTILALSKPAPCIGIPPETIKNIVSITRRKKKHEQV